MFVPSVFYQYTKSGIKLCGRSFQKAADILVRNLHGIAAVKASLADWQIPHHFLQTVDGHIAERIRADHFTDFFRGMCMGDQLLIGGHIRPEIAGIKERRRADPHMNLLGTGFFIIVMMFAIVVPRTMESSTRTSRFP